jgi:hypothetical protein
MNEEAAKISRAMRAEFSRRGFVVCAQAVAPHRLGHLWRVVASKLDAPAAKQRRGETYAVRNLLSGRPALVPVLASLGIDRIAESALGVAVVALDATFFDKNAGANWTVPSHQDVIMPAVAAPADSQTFVRFGATYAEAPEQVLRSLVAIRIHFDDCPPDNGALAVVPGSHHRRMEAADLAALGPDAFVVCPCRAGDVLVMSPLLVHRSSPATQPNHRKVLHVVYSPSARR